MRKYFLLCCLILTSVSLDAQIVKFGFQKLVNEKPDVKMPFAIVNDGQKTFDALFLNKVNPKSVTKEYIYVTSTPKKIQELIDKKLISDFHFEVSHPVVLNDSTRMKHFVNEVQAGTGGLPMPFTGKNVIVGIVDNGIDFYHPDFKNADGSTRFLYFWDQNLDSIGNPRIPQPYDYGLEYDSVDINANTFPGLGGNVEHGTLSTGIACGNGLANGKNKGMAPDSKIIFVKTNFNMFNWTLTVADACDYIFTKADELGMPCVINLSLGDIYGSHDGSDPAAELMEDLVDEKRGRIIVCSAGNFGNKGKYHVTGVVDADTSFVWVENNASGAFGANTIYFDLWASMTDMQNVSYSFGANLSSGSFDKRSTTIFRNAMTSMGGVILDTLRNSNGDQLATLEIYLSQENQNYRLEAYFSQVDSTSYFYSFNTVGNGKYDIWSGTFSGLNNLVTTIPTSAVYPPIVNYNMPDSLQNIVSSYNCSEKMVSVGNVVNQTNYLDVNSNVQVLPANFFSDVISPNSSRGPSRVNLTKPDISASGDFSFAPVPLSLIANVNYAAKLDQGGWHGRAGGTSASGPVVAGIAALYLERCNTASYSEFLTDIKNTAFSDSHTGTLPNNSYGFGKINALETLLEQNYSATFSGTALTCLPTNSLSLVTTVAFDSVVWLHEGVSVNQYPLIVSEGGEYVYKTYKAISSCIEADTLSFLGISPSVPTISNVGGVLTCTTSPNYQWYTNGLIMNGQTFQFLTGSILPNRLYTCCTKSPEGCESCSNQFQLNVGIDELSTEIGLFPNPTENSFEIINVPNIQKVILEDINGKKVKEISNNTSKIDISELKKGIYFVKIITENQILFTKVERL